MWIRCILLFLLSFSYVFAASDTSKPSVQTAADPGTVALTFDDGPSPVYTPEVLAILKKYNVKATFFVVGENAKKYPELVKEIHNQGHVVASHSYSHPLLTKLSDKQLQHEITAPQTIVVDIIGIKPKCLRYPFGMSNEHVRAAIRAQGITPVSMGFNSFDYENRGTQKLIDWVLKNAHSKQVILLHDGYQRKEQTVAALPYIIEGIKKKGLGFSTICG